MTQKRVIKELKKWGGSVVARFSPAELKYLGADENDLLICDITVQKHQNVVEAASKKEIHETKEVGGMKEEYKQAKLGKDEEFDDEEDSMDFEEEFIDEDDSIGEAVDEELDELLESEEDEEK